MRPFQRGGKMLRLIAFFYIHSNVSRTMFVAIEDCVAFVILPSDFFICHPHLLFRQCTEQSSFNYIFIKIVKCYYLMAPLCSTRHNLVAHEGNNQENN